MVSLLLTMGVVGLVACGNGDDLITDPSTTSSTSSASTTSTTSTSPTSSTTTPTTLPAQLPEDGDTIVAQFTTGGGLTGPCCPPGTIPEVTAYADGRIVVADPDTGTRQVTADPVAIADLLSDARNAGLLGDVVPDTGTLCCDLAYTEVVLADRTATQQLEVVGLDDEFNDSPDLTPQQRAVRQALNDLRDGLEALAS